MTLIKTSPHLPRPGIDPKQMIDKQRLLAIGVKLRRIILKEVKAGRWECCK